MSERAFLPAIPSAGEVEASFMATILQNGKLVKKFGALRPDDFEIAVYAEAWRIALEFDHDGATVTPELLGTRMGKADVGAILSAFMGAVNVDDYARTIRERSIRRRLSGSLGYMAEQAANLDVPVEEVIAGAMGDLAVLAADGSDRSRTKSQIVREIGKSLKESATVYSTGYPSIDKVMGGGLYAGKMYVVAGRKKSGKTLITGGMSGHLNRQGVRHLFVSNETPPREMEARHIAAANGFNSVKFLRKDDLMLEQTVENYLNTELDETIYEYCPGATFDQVRAIMSKHVATGQISGVFLDTFQRVKGQQRGQSQAQFFDDLADWLADFARRENVFMVVAAQINQDDNSRGGEGIRLAADMYLTLHHEKGDEGAWLEMGESRYMPYQNVGSETVPGLWLEKAGPHFADALFHA